MKNLNLVIDTQDLKVLYTHTWFAYPGITYEVWEKKVMESYMEYFNDRDEPKTISQWVNGQIMALAYS